MNKITVKTPDQFKIFEGDDLRFYADKDGCEIVRWIDPPKTHTGGERLPAIRRPIAYFRNFEWVEEKQVTPNLEETSADKPYDAFTEEALKDRDDDEIPDFSILDKPTENTVDEIIEANPDYEGIPEPSKSDDEMTAKDAIAKIEDMKSQGLIKKGVSNDAKEKNTDAKPEQEKDESGKKPERKTRRDVYNQQRKGNKSS